MPQEMRFTVRCPKCGWRIFDKVTPTTGMISVKCPKCRNIVQVDLSLRRAEKYRKLESK